MYGGFSKDARYLTPYQWDLERKHRLDFKLKLASLVEYPLLVISYEEVEAMSPEDTLTILDGIIGSIVASGHFHTQLKQNLKDLGVSAIGEHQVTSEDIQEMVWETDCKRSWNGILLQG